MAVVLVAKCSRILRVKVKQPWSLCLFTREPLCLKNSLLIDIKNLQAKEQGHSIGSALFAYIHTANGSSNVDSTVTLLNTPIRGLSHRHFVCNSKLSQIFGVLISERNVSRSEKDSFDPSTAT